MAYINRIFLKKGVDRLGILKYNDKAVWETDMHKWDLSSAGRASALQAEGHRFEPYRSHLYGGIAQLARAYGSCP